MPCVEGIVRPHHRLHQEGASGRLRDRDGRKRHKHGKGYFIEPTVFDDLTSAMTIAEEEIFGPELSVIKVSNADEAVRVANDTLYELAASIFTANLGEAVGHLELPAFPEGVVRQ
ncbi:aldehyde dehydrogenase family protein [Mesorhizobium sp. M0085]|uniref:aldehyde dehydrogenase family protein n=1 Tax=Mesorhizobium sp. M0085 TaxID=2956872 RepID=UPI0033392C60